MDTLREKFYCLMKDVYVYSREQYDSFFAKSTDFKIIPRSLLLVQLNKNDKNITRHDITVEIKDRYFVQDIHNFINKSQIDIKPDENEYFLVVEYSIDDKVYKYLRPIDSKQDTNNTIVFPVYSPDDIINFNKESVANGILISSVNSTIDITDELHMHSGPKGNFYADITDHNAGFKLEWIPLLENIPSNINSNNINVEILTYHGTTYVFSNSDAITIKF